MLVYKKEIDKSNLSISLGLIVMSPDNLSQLLGG